METELGIGTRVEHAHYGRGVIVVGEPEYYIIWFKSQQGTKIINKNFPEMEVIEATAATGAIPETITIEDIERSLEHILDRRLSDTIVPMGTRWNKGTLVLKPGDTSLLPKEIPLEVFFHKIVLVRDKLRLIEQKINAHKGLTDEEKVDIQQYITGIYGSLTTFNVLFKETMHQFKGAGTSFN
jgi:hypothetical protein